MKLSHKLILPLIDKSLTLEDISEKTGFVDLYTEDINRPYLDRHVFLMYKRSGNIEYMNVLNKLCKLPTLHNKRNVKIDDVLYVVFCFISNKEINYIKQNASLMLVQKDRMRICAFWDFTDSQINDFIINFPVDVTFSDNFIPEEDYNPKDFLTYDKEGQRLVLRCRP